MSRRLRLATWAARALVRPSVARSAPAAMRARFERTAARLMRAPPYTLVTDIRVAPGLMAKVVANRPGSHPPQRGRVILWFHGGAFVAGSPATHAAMLARLARLTRLEAVLPAYRLAPEHPFPTAVEDARTAFEALLARGYEAGGIVLGGDSAGGNLALGLLASLLVDGLRPAGLVAFSPLVDLTFSGASFATNEARDPVLPAARRGDLDRYYLAGADPADPRASPLFAPFPDPPPVFLQYSASEILADDSRRMAAKLRASGGRVILDEWPDVPHVFPILDGWVPEAREGLVRAAGFIDGVWSDRG